MTPGDAARLLTKAAAFDQRTIGESDVLAWHEAIGDLNADDAMMAVTRFYSTVTDGRLMPGHVRTLVGEIQRERRRAAREAAEQRAIEAAPAADQRPLRNRAPDLVAFVDSVRDVVGPGRPEELSYGRKHWGGRTKPNAADAGPNPDYDPTMGAPVEWQAAPSKAEPFWWQDERARERHAIELLAEAGRLTPKDAK